MIPPIIVDRGSSIVLAMLRFSALIVLCAGVVGYLLLALANPAMADDTTANGYRSAAVVLVTTEPLTRSSLITPMEPIATAPPSKALFVGNADVAMRRPLPPKFLVGKVVTDTAGAPIGIITRVDGEQIVLAVGNDLGAGTYATALNWNHFATQGKGKEIQLVTTLSKAQLKTLPEYRSLD